jgi:hypothetical protein
MLEIASGSGEHIVTSFAGLVSGADLAAVRPVTAGAGIRSSS